MASQSFKKLMKSLSDNEVIFLGSRKGFFFIGTKKDWEEKKDKIEEWCKAATQSEYRAAVNLLYERIANGIRKRQPDEEEDTYLKQAIYEVNILNQVASRVLQDGKAVDKYRCVEDRMVTETYLRESGDGRIVLVTGIEPGRFWFKEEFDAWWKEAMAS